MKLIVTAYCRYCSAPIYAPATVLNMAVKTRCAYSCSCHKLLQANLRAENDLLREQLHYLRTCHRQQLEGDEWKCNDND